jgi:hypothetical protein
MIEGAVKSRRRSRRSPTLRRETWRIPRQLRLPIRGSKAPPKAGGKSPPLEHLPRFHPVRGAPSRPHQNGGSPARLADRCARAVRCSSGSVFLREARSPVALGDYQDLRCPWVQLWGRHGRRRAIADPRLMSSSRATRTANPASSCSTAGALGLLGPLLDLLPPLEPPEVRGRRLCRGPPAAVHHDKDVIARRVSVATLTVPDPAVRPSPLTDRRQERRERAPPRPSAPPTGSRQSTVQREDERQPICELAGAGPPHD